MSSYLALLLFTFAIIWSSTHAEGDEEIKKVFKNFGENLFHELDQFSSFPVKDSDAINVQHKLEPILFSRRRRSFPDNPGEQQAGEFSDKTNLDGIQSNPNDVFPDLSSDREELKPPETNALISEQMIKTSSDPDKMAGRQSETVNKAEQSQNSVAGQQQGMDSPVETQGNALGQQQKQPLVMAENDVAMQETIQSQNNVNGLQQSAPIQSVAPQQSVPIQQNALQQQSAPVQQNALQQQSVPIQQNALQQQSAPVQQNVVPQAAPVQQNVLQQQAAPVQNNVLQQQVAPVQNNVLQQQAAPVQNNVVPQVAPVQNNGLLQPAQAENNGLLQQTWIQNSSSVPVIISNDLNQVKNYVPKNQQDLHAETQNHQIIDNGGLYANQPTLINGNDQYADQSIGGLQTNKTYSPSEFSMINKLRPSHVADNQLNVKQPDDLPKVYITPQAVRPGQLSVTPSKTDSPSRAPFFIISTLRNLPKESEHSQEFGKPVSDDGWYYNQEIDDSLHQVFNNDLWQKNRKQYLMNKKAETFEPMSMALFYSWIALATLAVLAILTVFRHRHKVTGYVYDLRHWHNGGYVEEGRRLLHNAYA